MSFPELYFLLLRTHAIIKLSLLHHQYFVILSGVIANARELCKISRKRNESLVPGEAGRRRAGWKPLQSQQPQTEPARLLPPPAGHPTQPQLPAAQSSLQPRRKEAGIGPGVSHTQLELWPRLLLLRHHLPPRDHEVRDLIAKYRNCWILFLLLSSVVVCWWTWAWVKNLTKHKFDSLLWWDEADKTWTRYYVKMFKFVLCAVIKIKSVHNFSFNSVYIYLWNYKCFLTLTWSTLYSSVLMPTVKCEFVMKSIICITVLLTL